ncbi:hypothetical protein SAMN04488139_0129 [Pseudidiomarina donghaiensis]|nr:hypothetical protein SAMN04488139_0129 [Pseudidiomarina donghaiensis]
MSGKNLKQELMLYKWRSKYLPTESTESNKNSRLKTGLDKSEKPKKVAFSL